MSPTNKPATAPGDEALPKDFKDLLSELVNNRVEFVLVGAYAVGHHGVIRATGDIDIFFDTSTDNVKKVVQALLIFGAPKELADQAALEDPSTVTQIGVEPNRVDMLGSISGVSFEEAIQNAFTVYMDGIPVPVIGLAELIRNKQAAGRVKDLNDIAQLQKVKPGHAQQKKTRK